MALHSPLRKCCEFAPRDLSRSCGQRKHPPDPAMGCTEKDLRDRPRLMQVLQILKDVNGRGIAQAAEDSLATTKLWCGLIASD